MKLISANKVVSQSSQFILSSISLIASLAWYDLVESIVKKFHFFNKNSLLNKFLYAVIITIVTILILQYFHKKNKNKN